MRNITYPYLPEGRTIQYVPADNTFMKLAEYMTQNSGCTKQPTGAVVIKDGAIIGMGANSGVKVEVCPRWGSPSGTNYGPCKDVCKQVGHAEVCAIDDAHTKGNDTNGADLYLWGHWWCCKNCWDTMIGAGIENVYLMENSENQFNPDINTIMQEWGKPKD